MSTGLIWQTISTGSDATRRLGELLGSKLHGNESIELVSDLGGGKTELTKGLAKGLGSQDIVTSPTFTINNIYKAAGGVELHHFDFYRLSEPGVLREELRESLGDDKIVTVVEWSDIVKDVLPKDCLSIHLTPSALDSDERIIEIRYPEKMSDALKAVQTEWERVEP